VNHHAAQIDVRRSVSDPVHDATVNILGGLELMQACSRHGVHKFVYASTGGALYGEGRELPATESHPVNPEAPYGASKHALEHYLYIAKLLHGLHYTVLRYPNVYGPRQNPHGEAGVNAIFIGLMLEGRRPKIFGTGEQVRDYLFVDDVVDANVVALEKGDGEMLNLGTGVGTSVLDIVRELNAILGTQLDPIHEPARPGEIQRIYLDAARARQVLGWTPRVPFREGLRRTVEWSRHNPLPVR
jgi:UDP-glucose 4-epimerase